MFLLDIFQNRQVLLTVLWVSIQICLLAYTISAWVAAGNVRSACSDTAEEASIDRHEGFVLVWQSLLAIALSVGGTFLLKKHRNPMSLGFLIGVTVLMSNWMLCIAVQEGGQVATKAQLAKLCGDKDYAMSADRSVSTFAVFLCFLYLAFGVILARSKDEILGEAEEPLMGDRNTEYHANAFPKHEPVV